MNFEVIPLKQCGPLSWSMSPVDVERAVGAPIYSNKNRTGNRIEFRFNQSASFIFDKTIDKLIEISCSGGDAGLTLGGLNLNEGDTETIVADTPGAGSARGARIWSDRFPWSRHRSYGIPTRG